MVETLTSDGETEGSKSHRPGFKDGLKRAERRRSGGDQGSSQSSAIAGASSPTRSRAEAAHIAEQSIHDRKPAEAEALIGDRWNIETDPEARRQHLEADRKRIADERREEMQRRRAEKDDHDDTDQNSRRR